MSLNVDEKTRQRFWKFVAIAGEDDCWLWTGCVVAGTGRFGTYKTNLPAQSSRVAYILTFGEIPEGKRVRHTCSSPLCCNPAHLVLSSDVEERFWKYVDKTPGLGIGNCWLWTGRITAQGYGQFSPSHSKRVNAHRFALMLTTGENPTEEIICCHRCDIRACVRSDHLFWGTATDNQRDMTSKGRHRWGKNNGQAKLTEEQVMEIRELLKEGQYSQQEIGKMFGVCQTAISRIKVGTSWNPNELTPRRLRKK